jgi:hypothetical protein
MTKQQRASSGRDQRRGDAQSHNRFLRLFGSSRELLAKSNAALSRLVDSLSRSEREALWALMDCAVTVFHIADWIRATHIDHYDASFRFAQGSQGILWSAIMRTPGISVWGACNRRLTLA